MLTALRVLSYIAVGALSGQCLVGVEQDLSDWRIRLSPQYNPLSSIASPVGAFR